MRGKAACRKSLMVAAGITPAYAGKSFCNIACDISIGDHPRVCGEKPVLRVALCIEAGITPAYAGKRQPLPGYSRTYRDHPRVCGEKKQSKRAAVYRRGSPPRMRGKVGYILASISMRGITPAYAGKRAGSSGYSSTAGDHPRVCGEKWMDLLFPYQAGGSPPRMRGKDGQTHEATQRTGITPAYAGKRLRVCGIQKRLRDHPRVCGEKSSVLPSLSPGTGSPPRMRGKGVQPCNERVGVGITPAYAGKSVAITCRAWYPRDHPRVCGEKSLHGKKGIGGLGSPPRMRGKDSLETVIKGHPGITPAYAGKRLKRSHSIGHFSCILCLFHSVLHRASVSDGSRAGPCAPPCLPAQNAVPV